MFNHFKKDLTLKKLIVENQEIKRPKNMPILNITLTKERKIHNDFKTAIIPNRKNLMTPNFGLNDQSKIIKKSLEKNNSDGYIR